MAFDVHDYIDLVRLLQEHPEWRGELRRLLLTDELLALPEIVRELAEAQRRTEERVGRVQEAIAALAEAQRRTEERVGRVEERVGRVEERVGRVEEAIAALAEAQRRTEERVGRVEEQIAALAEAQRRTEEQVRALAAAQESFARRQEWLTTVVSDLINTVGELTTTVRELTATVGNLKTTVGDLKGRVLEGTYRDKASSYFGPLLRRLRVVDPYTLEDTLRRHLSPEEFYDVLLLDLLLCGQPREQPRIPDLWLAVEISAVVDQGDVERVRRRATYLRRAGYRVIPLVAGERATLGAEDEARRHQVAVMQDGRVFLWQEALRAWIENA